MNFLAEDIQSYKAAIGLLAVHSAISLGDAITVGLSGKRGTRITGKLMNLQKFVGWHELKTKMA